MTGKDAIRKTLLVFNNAWWKRKNKTGKTWDEIMKKGIETFEVEQKRKG